MEEGDGRPEEKGRWRRKEGRLMEVERVHRRETQGGIAVGFKSKQVKAEVLEGEQCLPEASSEPAAVTSETPKGLRRASGGLWLLYHSYKIRSRCAVGTAVFLTVYSPQLQILLQIIILTQHKKTAAKSGMQLFYNFSKAGRGSKTFLLTKMRTYGLQSKGLDCTKLKFVLGSGALVPPVLGGSHKDEIQCRAQCPAPLPTSNTCSPRNPVSLGAQEPSAHLQKPWHRRKLLDSSLRHGGKGRRLRAISLPGDAERGACGCSSILVIYSQKAKLKIVSPILTGKTFQVGTSHASPLTLPRPGPAPSAPSVRSPWLHGRRGERPAAQKAPAKTPGKNRRDTALALDSGTGQPTRGSAPLSRRCAPPGGERGAAGRAGAAGACRPLSLRFNCQPALARRSRRAETAVTSGRRRPDPQVRLQTRTAPAPQSSRVCCASLAPPTGRPRQI
ncbi:hypothetical protein HPG69_014217 [Diceros bicornis minor]|uniref:Uncharacterized protein n=1 Tax=Diceros bicornis minor TaxID=77932 RepID=A0A7J7EVX5_DICBM|nr:hypothetical protein HPG69_014217 [Diceros bicornis minor]